MSVRDLQLLSLDRAMQTVRCKCMPSLHGYGKFSQSSSIKPEMECVIEMHCGQRVAFLVTFLTCGNSRDVMVSREFIPAFGCKVVLKLGLAPLGLQHNVREHQQYDGEKLVVSGTKHATSGTRLIGFVHNVSVGDGENLSVLVLSYVGVSLDIRFLRCGQFLSAGRFLSMC